MELWVADAARCRARARVRVFCRCRRAVRAGQRERLGSTGTAVMKPLPTNMSRQAGRQSAAPAAVSSLAPLEWNALVFSTLKL